MAHRPSTYPASLYRAQVGRRETYPAIEEDLSVDVAIVGAGFTGLSTALHLSEKGVRVVVLDACEPGWGASGRNGGQVNAGFKLEPGDIVRMLGPERGRRMVELGDRAPAYVGEIIRRYGISCGYAHKGTVRAVRKPSELDLLKRSAHDWASFGVPLKLLARDETAAEIGGGDYAGAILDGRGASVNPLAYSLGLAAAAVKLGARIHGDSRVLRIAKAGAGHWALTTGKGTVKATNVVLAMNGYVDGAWSGLSRQVVPVFTGIAATARLPDHIASQILPNRQVVYESSWRVLYYRVDGENRLLMGGPSPQRDTGQRNDYAYLVRATEHIFPGLRGVEWDYFWNGQVAVTKDHLPKLFEPAEGVIAAFGYNGRGIAMGTSMGRIVAERILGSREEDLDIPMKPADAYRMKSFWRPAAELSILRDRLRDRMAGLK